MIFVVGGNGFRRNFSILNRSKIPLMLFNKMCNVQKDDIPRSMIAVFMSSSNATDDDSSLKKKILFKSLIKRRTVSELSVPEESRILSKLKTGT